MVLKATDDQSIQMLRSGFGKQVRSIQSSNPEWGFGTGHRETAMKQYLSPEQTKAIHISYSQGPVYKTYSAIGPQVESKMSSSAAPGFGTSTRPPVTANVKNPGPGTYRSTQALGTQPESKRSTSPRTVFGTATRDQQSKVWLDEELMKTSAGGISPGPNNYAYPPGIGKQSDSKYPTLPGWKQGTSLRFKAPVGGSSETPAPNTYQVKEAIGKQVQSAKSTLPAHKIGTSQRDHFKKVFITKEHEKSMYGENSPGPTTSEFVSAIGEQTLSVKKSAPSWGFGTARRIQAYDTPTPGPGAYYA